MYAGRVPGGRRGLQHQDAFAVETHAARQYQGTRVVLPAAGCRFNALSGPFAQCQADPGARSSMGGFCGMVNMPSGIPLPESVPSSRRAVSFS